MAELLPLKFSILRYASKVGKEFSVNDVLRDLKNDYGSDGQFNKKMVGNHLDSLRAVGMLEVAKAEFDASGDLQIDFRITDYGTGRMSYLPTAFQN